MSREKKRETEKTNKKQIGKRWLVLPLMMILLISGILFVDQSYRSMMMIQGPKVLGIEKINKNIYIFTFCGDHYCINKKELYEGYNSIKKEIITFVENVKKQKEMISK